jgi:hypothetical protein
MYFLSTLAAGRSTGEREARDRSMVSAAARAASTATAAVCAYATRSKMRFVCLCRPCRRRDARAVEDPAAREGDCGEGDGIGEGADRVAAVRVREDKIAQAREQGEVGEAGDVAEGKPMRLSGTERLAKRVGKDAPSSPHPHRRPPPRPPTTLSVQPSGDI